MPVRDKWSHHLAQDNDRTVKEAFAPAKVTGAGWATQHSQSRTNETFTWEEKSVFNGEKVMKIQSG